MSASGYKWSDISPCVEWMKSFFYALREEQQNAQPNSMILIQPGKTFQNIPVENQHNIQSHTVELAILDKAQDRLAEIRNRQSPEPSLSLMMGVAANGEVIMTPPEEEGDIRFYPNAGVSKAPATPTTPKSSTSAGATASSVFLSPETPPNSMLH